MIFDGFDFKDLLFVEYIDRTLMPPIGINADIVPGKLGSLFRDSQLGSGKVTVKCRVVGDTRIEVQKTIREVAGKLYTSSPRKLELRDEPDKYNMAIVGGDTQVDKFLETGYVELDFILTDPCAYSVEEKTVAINSSFTYNGTAEGYAILTIKPTAGPKLTITNNGTTIEVIYAFVGSESVVVDLEKRLVTINGSNSSKYVSLESNYFKMEVGSNKVVANGTGTVKYRDRWL